MTPRRKPIEKKGVVSQIISFLEELFKGVDKGQIVRVIRTAATLAGTAGFIGAVQSREAVHTAVARADTLEVANDSLLSDLDAAWSEIDWLKQARLDDSLRWERKFNSLTVRSIRGRGGSIGRNQVGMEGPPEPPADGNPVSRAAKGFWRWLKGGG